ncbi:MAG: CoA-binding protein [Candidatus Marinimicrobia bacterium]|jgi:hypothetical protein|nr:CoA-binding protein [Candidatus Neomarinimicrobiota bacterium]
MNEANTYQKIYKMKTIAVVGMSPKAERPSHYVALYLRDQGYTIIPVNPGQKEIAGEKCYPSLKEIPVAVDVVDVFRNPEHVEPIVDAAIEIEVKALWLQDGVINEKAGQKAEEAGLLVIMNDCMMRKHRQLNA